MDSSTSEIKAIGLASGKLSEYVNDQAKVQTVRWSAAEPGVLSVAIGNSVQDYDTYSGSRPVLIRASHAKQDILDFALSSNSSSILLDGGAKFDMALPDRLSTALYSRRMIAVLSDRSLRDLEKNGGSSPVAISRRDGRLVHTLGSTVWVGSTTSGPAAMEKSEAGTDEDISATMMRRARCFRVSRYSMNTSQNIKVSAQTAAVGLGLVVPRKLTFFF